MNLKKLSLLTVLTVSAAAPALAMEGVTANVGFTTDYVFRGFSQTDEAAAIQGGFDYEHDNGFYAGVWGSNVDFNNTLDGSLELDVYGGFSDNIDAFSYDVGAIYYAYPGADDSLNYDFWEAYVGVGYEFERFALNASVNHSPEFFGDAGDATYYALGLDVALPEEFTLSAHYGHQDIQEGNDYSDWSVGVSKTWLEFDWAVTYYDTDVNNDDLADGRVVLSVGKSF